MTAAAAAWDVLAKAANLAQMSGLHAAMLVAVLTTLLRLHQRNKRECARLERCHRRLRALLQWPPTTTTGCGGVVLLLCTETGEDPFGKALGDAAGLVDSYRKSTLWRRVRSSGSTATKLRDMQDVLNSYRGLLLFVNAHLLLRQHAAHRHHHAVPPSPDTSTTTIPEANDAMSPCPSAPGSPSPSAQAVTSPIADTHRANGIGQGGIYTDPAGCERDVPAICCL